MDCCELRFLSLQGYIPFGAGGRFAWTKFIASDWATSTQIALDQVFISASALSVDEIRAIASRPPASGPLQSSLILYWTFENVSSSSPYWIFSDYGSVHGLLLESTFSFAEGLANPPARPTLIGSKAPFLGSGLTVVSQSDAQGASISALPGPQAGSVSVTSLPAAVQVFLLSQSGVPAVTPLQVSDLPAAAPYGIRIQGSQTANFSYVVGSDDASLVYTPNRAPQPKPLVLAYVDQQTSATLTVGSTYPAPPSKKKEVKYPLDMDGNDVVCRLQSLPSVGQVRDANTRAVVVSSQLPYIMALCAIVYSPPDDVTGENVTSFLVSVSDGIVSTSSNFSVSVINRFYPPRPKNVIRSSFENENVTITFSEVAANVAAFQVAHGGPIVYDTPFIQISTWPKLGRLFQTTSTGRIGAEILAVSPSVNLKTLWVSKGVNASSHYADPNDWSERELEGAPNAFPVYGDSPRAWAPAFPNEPEWVIVRFPEPLFPTRVDIYMNWYTGLVSRVSGWDGQRWQALWQVDSQTVVTPLDTSQVFSPPICPTSFPVDTILVETAAGGPLAYVEIDAISLTGATVAPQLNLVDMREARVTFVPGQYKNGNDSLVYTINRCINFARYRDVNAAVGSVNISIASVYQAPVFYPQNLYLDMSRNESSAPFFFTIGAEDVDDHSTLPATITRLPLVGKLFNVTTGAQLRVGSVFDASETLVYRAPSCLEAADLVYNATVRVSVSDGVFTAEGEVSIMVDCVSNVRRVSRGVEVLVFALSAFSCAVCLVFIGLVTVWRQRRSIQKISPLFCALTLIGALCINISPIFLTWSASSCYGWFSFFTLGLTIFLGAIAAKTCSFLLQLVIE